MIGWKHKHGRIADIALYAPLVLLPFVWFALGACGDNPAGSISNLTTVKPDGQVGNTPYYNYPDYTRYGSNVVCTSSGGYGGGSPAELQSTRATVANELQQKQNAYDEAKRTVEFCKNKTTTHAQTDAQQGCDRANHAPQLTHEQKTPVQMATYASCVASDSQYYNSPCADFRVSSAQENLQYYPAAIEKDKARLANIDACINDQKRRESAASRPQLDPNAAIIIMQGIGRRPPSGSSGHGGYSGQQSNHKH